MPAIYSMTGYGESSAAADAAGAFSVHADLRSVNGRFLDLSFRLPEELRSVEAALRSLLSAQLRRGKVDCRLSLETPQATQGLPSTEQIAPLLEAQQALLQRWPQLLPLSVAEAWRLSATQTPTTVPADVLATAAQRATTQALQALQAARAREGDRLRAFLLERCARLRELAAQADSLVPQAVARQQQRFVARMKDAMQLLGADSEGEQAQDRLLHETASFALRIDVAEELSRLQSHLEAVSAALREGGEVGKRLDFLIQELHREANTLGSKSALHELSEVAVEMKVCIEQMREQVQNLE